MTRALLTILAVLLLLPTIVGAAAPKILLSVRPLQVLVADVVMVDDTTAVMRLAFANICTVSSIHEKYHLCFTKKYQNT